MVVGVSMRHAVHNVLVVMLITKIFHSLQELHRQELEYMDLLYAKQLVQLDTSNDANFKEFYKIALQTFGNNYPQIFGQESNRIMLPKDGDAQPSNLSVAEFSQLDSIAEEEMHQSEKNTITARSNTITNYIKQ